MAEKKKVSLGKEFTKGLLIENPVLRLVLGTCPTLATTTSVVNGVGMGIAATLVLICSNVAISALRKVIPQKARIPAYIVIIASFVTVVQMLVQGFVPALYDSLGVFLPLIVVNCIILGRAEAFASKNGVLASAVDGLGMGVGFTAALFCMGAVREIVGGGTFLSGINSMLGSYIDMGAWDGFEFSGGLQKIGLAPMTLFILPAGGFFVFGILMACANRLAKKRGLEPAEFEGCKSCPNFAFCDRSERMACSDAPVEEPVPAAAQAKPAAKTPSATAADAPKSAPAEAEAKEEKEA